MLPDDESELNRLILFLDELGDRGGALSAFDEFARRLREDYDAAPSPETEALVRRIRNRNDSAPSPLFPNAAGRRAGGQKAQAPPALGARRRRMPAALIGLSLLVVMGLIGLVGRVNHISNGVIPTGRVILVLPLSPSQPDTALARLGRDLAATVSAALDGVGGLRTVDGLTALALTAECGDPCRGIASTRMARGLGATSLVRGTLHRTGNATRVDFEMEETDGQRTIVRGSTSLPAANLDALTDTVAWTLLRGIWRYGEPPSPSLGAVTTRKLPALRAFLEGEGNIVAGRWQDAARAYRAAMMADPGFWLAYQRSCSPKSGWRKSQIPQSSTASGCTARIFPHGRPYSWRHGWRRPTGTISPFSFWATPSLDSPITGQPGSCMETASPISAECTDTPAPLPGRHFGGPWPFIRV
jgi:hypothetical protein